MELDLLRYGVPFDAIRQMTEEEFIDYWTNAVDQVAREVENAARSTAIS